MDVLYLTEYFQTPSEGGLMRTWELSKFLVEHGQRVTVVVPAPHHMTGEVPKEMGRRLWYRYTEYGITVIKTWAYPGFRNGTFGRIVYYLTTPIFAMLACMRQSGDVMIGSSPPFFLAPMAFLLSRLRRVPFVLEVRDGWLEFAIAKGMIPKPLARILAAEQRWLFRKSDRIVAVTPGINKFILEQLPPAERDKVLLIMNGFEEDVFAAADPARADQLRAEHGLAGKFVAIYAGTLGLARDCAIIVRAAELLQSYPDIVFVVVGEGEGKAGMQSYVKEKALGNCLFIPMQPRREMPAWFGLSAVGLNSIRAGEGLESSLSNKIFDCLGSGVPMVFSGAGDTQEFLERCGGGIVVPAQDAQAMAGAILKLYQDGGLRAQMGSQGREYVIDNYSRSKLLQPWYAMLTNLAPAGTHGKSHQIGPEPNAQR